MDRQKMDILYSSFDIFQFTAAWVVLIFRKGSDHEEKFC